MYDMLRVFRCNVFCFVTEIRRYKRHVGVNFNIYMTLQIQKRDK